MKSFYQFINNAPIKILDIGDAESITVIPAIFPNYSNPVDVPLTQSEDVNTLKNAGIAPVDGLAVASITMTGNESLPSRYFYIAVNNVLIYSGRLATDANSSNIHCRPFTVKKGDSIIIASSKYVTTTYACTVYPFKSALVKKTLASSHSPSIRGGMCIPCHNVTFGGSDGRRPIFWGESEPNENYCICDGGDDGFGGTVPDMRDRMLLGASPTYPAGTAAGERTIDISGLTVDEATLSIQQMPNHPHPLRYVEWAYADGRIGGYREYTGSGNVSKLNGAYAVGGSEPHTHTLSGDTETIDYMPPFYSLSFVIYLPQSGE